MIDPVPLPARLVIDMQGSLANNNPAIEAAKRGVEAPQRRGLADRIDARSIADAKASGLSAIGITVGHVVGPGNAHAESIADLREWHAFVAASNGALAIVNTADDLASCRAAGTIGVILGFQNTEMLGDDLSRVDDFAAHGVRVMQLTYNTVNRVGCGCMASTDHGLSEFGREAVQRMNDQAVLIDLSHASPRTLRDAMQASSRPIVVTHAGCKALADWPRNVSDDDLRALANQGGVMGVYAMPFLRMNGQPHLDDFVRHIEHALHVAGEDAVGIGSDGTVSAIDDMAAYMGFLAEDVAARRASGVGAAGESEAIALFLPDMQGPSKFDRLRDALARRSHSAARVDKIMGGNWLRVF